VYVEGVRARVKARARVCVCVCVCVCVYGYVRIYVYNIAFICVLSLIFFYTLVISLSLTSMIVVIVVVVPSGRHAFVRSVSRFAVRLREETRRGEEKQGRVSIGRALGGASADRLSLLAMALIFWRPYRTRNQPWNSCIQEGFERLRGFLRIHSGCRQTSETLARAELR